MYDILFINEMCPTDTRFCTLLEPFVDDLESSNEDLRRQATLNLYERIIVQYADVSESSIPCSQ